MYGEGYSLSDIAAATGNGNNSGNGFGDGFGAWWIIIFLIFAFGGWGNNGWGNNGGSNGSSGAIDNYVLASDFATLQRQLDSGFSSVNSAINQVNQGLCNGFYQELVNINGVNSNIANSTATLQQTLCQGFNGVNTAMLQGNNALASQLADCCCENRSAIAQVRYDMATQACDTRNTIQNSTRDIVDSQVNGTRAILDAITANRIEDKNAQITAQQNEINALRLAASQQAQNNYLISQLGQKCPEPAYLVCNPNGPLNYSVQTGCGCGC